MSNEYLRMNDTRLNIEQAQNLIAKIDEKRKAGVSDGAIQSENDLFSALFAAFKDFFSKLGKPTLQKRLIKKESPARSSDYNDTMVELNNDIKVAYSEIDSLSSMVVKDFNYSESQRQMLLGKVQRLSSDVTDYSLLTDGAKNISLYAADSFVDNSKIDFSMVSSGTTAAELVTDQGIITLKRVANIDRNKDVQSVVGVRESIPTWNASAETGGYEGLYFGIKNEARPEGGQWHVTFSSDGTKLTEHGASEDEKMPMRLKMFDNNPDTFWEVECITDPIVGYRDKYSGKQISVSEFNELTSNELDSPGVTAAGGAIITSNNGSLIENYVPVTNASTVEYLTCSFIVNLRQSRIINWISLNPNNFGLDLYMDILSIQTSSDGSQFVELDGFDDHEYSNTLTKKANRELNPDQVQDTLSPDKYGYSGQGLWVFAPREVRSIKFEVRQTRSYLKQYEIVTVEIEQTVTTTTTKSYFFGLINKSSTSTSNIRRNVDIPYLTGIVCGYDVMSLEPGSIAEKASGVPPMLAAIGGAVVGGVVGAAVGLGIGGGMAGLAAGGPIGLAVGFILGGLFGSSKQTSTSVGPATITRQWTTLKNDKARFTIGIRDINIYSYRFAETSEIVSLPYNSPNPIAKVTVDVDETIPKQFYSDSAHAGTENDWIKYYVSFNNGSSWSRISPTNHRTTISDDGVNPVPEIINVNSTVSASERDNPLAYVDTAAAVYQVRFKAVLSRPTDIDSSDSYTPVLSKYALQIYPLGGL
jgi:hypothetical protein